MLNSAEFAGFVDRIADLTNANLDALRLGKQSWAKQFEEALNVNGGDLETATAFSYLLHFMTFGFKVSIVLEDKKVCPLYIYLPCCIPTEYGI